MMQNYKEFTRETIGWCYPDFKWFTEKEAKRANKERDALLKSFSKNREVHYSFMRNKIHIGELSPGCTTCGEGYWSCLFINQLCTAHCFYCPQDRGMIKEAPPKESCFTFNDLETYIAYLKRFNFKGVSFSGGEPFLVFRRLLKYTRRIREEFGNKIYIWMYTNGDLVTKDKLQKLKKAGLNEIRFNISARNYGLQPLKLAVGIVDTVTVEIPAITEDFEIVKECLPKIQEIGVKYLNLHQLNTNEYNYKNLINRGYTFVHQPLIPVFQSEITALKLMRYALDKKIGLPINYCSALYKGRLQGRAGRRWLAPIIKYHFEELTHCKYIRRLSIQDSPTKIKRIVRILKKYKRLCKFWLLNDVQKEIFIHSSLLEYIDFNKYSLKITYFVPEVKPFLMHTKVGKAIKLNSQNKVFIKRKLVIQRKLLNPATIKSFQELFIKNRDEKDILNNLYKNYNLTLNEWRKEVKLLLDIKRWEYGELGFPYFY